jgi:hypothetical protein
VIYEQACKAMLKCEVIIDTGFDLDGETNRNRQLLELAYNTNKSILSLRKQTLKSKAEVQQFETIGAMINSEKLKLDSDEMSSISLCS